VGAAGVRCDDAAGGDQVRPCHGFGIGEVDGRVRGQGSVTTPDGQGIERRPGRPVEHDHARRPWLAVRSEQERGGGEQRDDHGHDEPGGDRGRQRHPRGRMPVTPGS
jgi:hypothetical protein